MKNQGSATFANAFLVLTKGASAIRIFDTSGISEATLPVISILLLVTGSVLILKQIRAGALLAATVIAFFLIEFIVSGSIPRQFPYFIIHVAALVLNLVAWKAMAPDDPS